MDLIKFTDFLFDLEEFFLLKSERTKRMGTGK
jgi:hypothetical protein